MVRQAADNSADRMSTLTLSALESQLGRSPEVRRQMSKEIEVGQGLR